jgi:hypothetical protein
MGLTHSKTTVDLSDFQDSAQDTESGPVDYISPVLDGLTSADTINMPPESVACRHCPAAIWMLSGQELKAYCQALHVVIWSHDERSAPTRCDAQIAALAQLQRGV